VGITTLLKKLRRELELSKVTNKLGIWVFARVLKELSLELSPGTATREGFGKLAAQNQL